MKIEWHEENDKRAKEVKTASVDTLRVGTSGDTESAFVGALTQEHEFVSAMVQDLTSKSGISLNSVQMSTAAASRTTGDYESNNKTLGLTSLTVQAAIFHTSLLIGLQHIRRDAYTLRSTMRTRFAVCHAFSALVPLCASMRTPYCA